MKCTTQFDLTSVVKEYQSSLLQYATYLLGNKNDEAQDVVQEAFLRLDQHMQKEGKDADIKNLKSWLFRVTHNLAMDHGRKRARQNKLKEKAMNDPVAQKQALGNLHTKGNSYMKEETYALAMHELNELPHEQKTVLLLKLIEGATLREISETTGLKIGTVHYRLQQGLSTLSTKLKEIGAV